MDIEKISQGLASAFVIEQATSTRARALRVLALFALIDIGLIIWGPTWLRWLGLVGLVSTVAMAIAVMLIGSIITRTVRRLARPDDLSHHREALANAIDRAAFPTGPVSGMQLAWRLRKGTGTEFERLRTILDELVADLDDDD